MTVTVWIASGILAGVIFGFWIGYDLGRFWAEQRWWKEWRAGEPAFNEHPEP